LLSQNNVFEIVSRFSYLVSAKKEMCMLKNVVFPKAIVNTQRGRDANASSHCEILFVIKCIYPSKGAHKPSGWK
jgi:hypothetical protein